MMDLNPVELVTQYGVLGGLLGIVLYWLMKHYLPELQRQHQVELDRILAVHEQSVFRLVAALERNTSVVQFVSQALLVQSFTHGGLDSLEAEQIARRIQFTALSACEPAGHSAPSTK